MRPYLLILGAGSAPEQRLLLGLQRVTLDGRVLDWQLDAFAAQMPEVIFVGGYDIEHVMSRYPDLTYHFNPDWQSTGSVHSLSLALESLAGLEANRDLYIVYSDILLRPELIRLLSLAPTDRISVALDNLQCKGLDSTNRPETIELDGSEQEFIGLVRVPKESFQSFRSLALKLARGLRCAHLSELFKILSASPDWSLFGVSASGNWAHAEHGRSVARFVMGSKAVTLDRLKSRLKHSKILPLSYFTRSSYQADRSDFLRRILKQFNSEKLLIVRSSASDEDGFENANAGRYHSELNVLPSEVELGDAIDKVFGSYGSCDPLDEVLIQPQLEDVMASGVIFTRMLESGAPYFVINYSQGPDTTAITAGTSSDSKKIYVSRMLPEKYFSRLPTLTKRLIQAAREIESIVHHDALDIEFAIDADDCLITLQVRPLMVSDVNQDRERDEDVADVLRGVDKALRGITTPPPGQVGRRTIWSVMADWNPAEIIGVTPAPLALDLYRRIITDRTWALQRFQVGYRDVREWPLIRSFGGQAFVDVRASLNSFVPASLPEKVAAGIVEFALERLDADPSLHDKIEFELVPTCLDFGFDDWEQLYLEKDICSLEEVSILRDGLRQVTCSIVNRVPEDIALAKELEDKGHSLARPREPFGDWLREILSVCSSEAALTFAHLARGGFVVAALLRSAVSCGFLTEERRVQLMESISGVGRMLTDAAIEVRNGCMDREAFIKRFGHLRPGTYDIMMPAYRDQPEIYLDPLISASQISSPNAFEWTPQERALLSGPLSELDIGLDVDGLLEFAHQAVAGREYSKFVFTRYLSEALDGLAEQAVAVGLPPKLQSSMPLSVWLEQSLNVLGQTETKSLLKEYTEQRERQHWLAGLISLPPLIREPNEIYAFEAPQSEPTFITMRSDRATLRVVSTGQVLKREQVEGCIVALPNADPGYDYLFALGIRGLVTAFGGPNSHMAIRACEFSVPAVIGIGIESFNKLCDGRFITLDCQRRLWIQDFES